MKMEGGNENGKREWKEGAGMERESGNGKGERE